MNGVDTRSLTYEETLALLTKPPKSDNEEREKGDRKSAEIGNCSEIERLPRDDSDTITIKAVRRLQNEAPLLSTQTCESATTDRGSEIISQIHIETTVHQNKNSPLDADCRNSVSSAASGSSFNGENSRGGDTGRVSKKLSGVRPVGRSPDCCKHETNKVSQHSTKLVYHTFITSDKD